MDELRFVRREDRSLVVANDAGEEFLLLVDDAVLSELRHLSRRERDTSKVRPREIQALIRSGRSLAETAQATGLEEADIERYAEPVLAERRYILERAHAVPVRTDAAADEEEQRFGAVIAERLVALGSEASDWSSWKDDESGWMVSLEFISRDVAHRAVWAFDHRKGALAAVNPDAVSLSKQGEVGDRLIPKLRAVDAGEPSASFDAAAFDGAGVDAPAEERGAAEPGAAAPEAESPAAPPAEPQAPADTEAEYARRREIDQRAVKTDADAPADLNQTADLLDALRKRRGERERDRAASTPESEASAPEPAERAKPTTPAGRSIWQGHGVSDDAGAAPAASTPAEAPRPPAETPEKGGKRGRASIPSWDDILFGTRSDEDPS